MFDDDEEEIKEGTLEDGDEELDVPPEGVGDDFGLEDDPGEEHYH